MHYILQYRLGKITNATHSEFRCIQSLLLLNNFSRQVRNGWHLSSTSHIDTSMTYCPWIILTLKIISVRCIPLELEIKHTTESDTSASYLDLLLSIGRDGQLHTSPYDKRDDLNFHITNFPFPSSNIPSSPAYGVFISQLIRYARASSSYECFILRAVRLSNKLLEQGYVKERLRSNLITEFDFIPNCERFP